MTDHPYLVLETCITVYDLCALPEIPDSYVPLLQARGFRIRTPEDFDGTLETWQDPTIPGRHFRQTLPRKEPEDA